MTITQVFAYSVAIALRSMTYRSVPELQTISIAAKTSPNANP